MFLFIRNLKEYTLEMTTFKYISCSYLSKNVKYVKQTGHLFKYISCSYLSTSKAMKKKIKEI